MFNQIFKNLYKLNTPIKEEYDETNKQQRRKEIIKKVIKTILIIFAILLMTVFLYLIFFNKKNKKKYFTNMIGREIVKHFEDVSERVLKFKKVSRRNKAFTNTGIRFGLKPLKINNVSTVFLQTKTDPPLVIKRTLVKGPTQEETVSTEIKHKNLLETYKHYYITTEQGVEHLWLISEYMDVTVNSRSLNRGEEDLRKIMIDILNGLVYLHDRNIAHLDLKIANIMGKTDFETGDVTYKIIDFGFARDLNLLKGQPDMVIIPGKSYGTYPYKPPEVVYGNKHGLKSDIWCIGAICWFLIEGRTPFYDEHGEKDKKVWHKFLKNPAVILPEEISNELYDFIDKCLQADPEKRPTAKELLTFPFIKGTKLPENYERRTKPGNFSDQSQESETDSYITTTEYNK